jgi:hypothetical protein
MSRERVQAMLDANPALRYALVTDLESNPAWATLWLGIRGVGTGQIGIKRRRYDGVKLLALLEKYCEVSDAQP